MASNNSPIAYILQEYSSPVKDMKVVAENGRRIIAEGILQTAEEMNRNGRYYQKKELFPTLNCGRIKELLETGNLKGEDGHPASKELIRQQTIDPMFTCVKYLKIWTEGDDVWGQFKGDNTARGEYFDLDLRDGDKPSFSLRALGSVEQKGGMAYVKNIRPVTWDRVYFPSHPRAYTKRIVSEGANVYVPDKLTQRGITESGMLTINGSTNNMFVGQNEPIPVGNNDVANYIKSESANVKTIINNFDIYYDRISVNERGKVEMIDKAGNKFIVNTEDYILAEIMNYI